jgi:hypothetical protein
MIHSPHPRRFVQDPDKIKGIQYCGPAQAWNGVDRPKIRSMSTFEEYLEVPGNLSYFISVCPPVSLQSPSGVHSVDR